jgi:hypothetical protein
LSLDASLPARRESHLTPSRVRRVVVILGAAACAAILAPNTRPSRADERPALPPWVQFDSIRVTNPVFSPNDDGVQDNVTVTLSFAESTRVFAHVSPAALPDTVAVLFDAVSPDRNVAFSFSWHGTDSLSTLQPEGDYTLHFAGLTLSDSTLFNQRDVRLDITPPDVEILSVDPYNYAPLTLHPDVTPEIRLRVSQSQLEDSLGVEIEDARVRRSLPLSGGFRGDGDYLALCEPCATGDFLDGLYVITATGKDAAGNHSEASFLLDKNIAGPTFDIELPRRPAGNQDPNGRVHFQFAESLLGRAEDRQPVDSVTVAIPFPPDTTRISLTRLPGDTLTVFSFDHDLSQLLTGERVYDMTLTGYDNAGVTAQEPVSIVIDRRRPDRPQITPRPPPQAKLEVLQFSVSVDLDSIRAVIIKGGLTFPGREDKPDTLELTVPQFTWGRTLTPGANLMSFESMDYARNISVADTVTVVWETSEGVAVPERFHPGQSIQVNVGDHPAQSVAVRILALDGSLVGAFEDASSRLVYEFPWDLTTREGRAVKNGAYLLWVQVRYPDGRENRFRRMIAVVQ